MMLLLFAFIGGTRAQEELTLYDGTATNSYVPFYGLYADTQGCASEFVIPADQLTELVGCQISGLKFYLSSPASAAWTGTHQVYLGDIKETTLTGISGPSAGTIVFEGSLDATGTELTIEFSSPYTYYGGNLLIGSYVSVAGNYKSASFFGEAQTDNTGWYRSSSSADGSGVKFLPKTTFMYIPNGPYCSKPTNFILNYTGGNTAEVNWMGEADSYNIDVNGTVTEGITTNSYTLTELELGTTYEVKVQAVCSSELQSNWTNVLSFTTDECMNPAEVNYTLTDSYGDGWNGNAINVIDVNGNLIKTLTISNGSTATGSLHLCEEYVQFVWVSGGSYSYPDETSWSFTDAQGNELFSGAGNTSMATGDILYTLDNSPCPMPTDLAVSEIGPRSAVLGWTENGEAKQWQICLNDDEANLIAANSNPFTIENLIPDTKYTAKVRAINGELESLWSKTISFTTDVAFPAPTDVTASNITATTATISWTGDAESYNVHYIGATSMNTDFDDSTLGGWTTIDADGDGYNWVLGSACGGVYLESGASLAGTGHNSSTDMAVSGSYSNVVGALTPDNYLVSPQVNLGGAITFWVSGQDAGYAAEHFGVAVSTTGNTNASDFTTIKEWTLDANGNGSKDQGLWGKFTVDLSAYSGKGYVAIRHFGCTDQFMLNVDDIEIFEPDTENTWATVETSGNTTEIEGLEPETFYIAKVQAVYAEGESSWATTSFQTLEDVPAPTELAASNIGARTVELSWTENGEATSWQICLNDDEANLIAADSNPFTIENLIPETEYTAKVRAIFGEKQSNWSAAITFTTDIAFPAPTELAANNVTSTTAEISWTADASATGAVVEYAEGTLANSEWYQYDNGTYDGSIGTNGGQFYWGIMLPAGSYTGNLLKVSIYDYIAMTGTITIYNDGDDAPAGSAIGSKDITLTGAEDFAEFSFDDLAIDATKNLWVIVYNGSGATYPAAYCNAATDANGRWVSIDGAEWFDVTEAVSSAGDFMIRAEIGTVIDPATLTWTTIADATSPCELTGLNPSTEYTVRVKSIYDAEGESQWATTSFMTIEANPVPFNITADLVADGATITWDGEGDSYKVQYRTAASDEIFFFEGFEDGLPATWTTIDADGDGNEWFDFSPSSVNDSNGNPCVMGTTCATSASYVSTALTPDNWLITPQLDLQGTMSVWLRGQDPSWAAEHFAIYLSTTGTEVDDFTTTLVDETEATGEFVEYTADLSAYAGQKGYIAIRHFNCTDMFRLNVDNFGLFGNHIDAGEIVELTTTEKTITISGLDTNKGYEYQIQSVKGEDESDWSETGEFALLTLGDDATNNTGLLLNNIGRQAHVTLANRTLFKDGNWNTITLPFHVLDLTEGTLAGATVKTLDDATMEPSTEVEGNSTVTLTFSDYDFIYAGYPFVIKWEQSGSDIVNPEFANVTIATATTYSLMPNDYVQFVGNFDAFPITAADEDIYYMISNNQLTRTGKDRTLKAFRGFFRFTETAATAREFVLDFGEGDTVVTGINDLQTAQDANSWYTVNGMKLNGKPARKGLYIQNGQKVVIK